MLKRLGPGRGGREADRAQQAQKIEHILEIQAHEIRQKRKSKHSGEVNTSEEETDESSSKETKINIPINPATGRPVRGKGSRGPRLAPSAVPVVNSQDPKLFL